MTDPWTPAPLAEDQLTRAPYALRWCRLDGRVTHAIDALAALEAEGLEPCPVADAPGGEPTAWLWGNDEVLLAVERVGRLVALEVEDERPLAPRVAAVGEFIRDTPFLSVRRAEEGERLGRHVVLHGAWEVAAGWAELPARKEKERPESEEEQWGEYWTTTEDD